MINIRLDNEMLEMAKSHATERMNYEYNRFSQSDEFRFNMILVGTIGELVFKRFLDEHNINYDMEFQAGEYDIYDFKINNEIFEIKTSGYEGNSFENLNLLYNYQQYSNPNRNNYSYVIQIFVNGYNRQMKRLNIDFCTHATIVGYIDYNQVKQFPLVNNKYYKNYKVPLSHLKSLSNILNYEV